MIKLHPTGQDPCRAVGVLGLPLIVENILQTRQVRLGGLQLARLVHQQNERLAEGNEQGLESHEQTRLGHATRHSEPSDNQHQSGVDTRQRSRQHRHQGLSSAKPLPFRDGLGAVTAPLGESHLLGSVPLDRCDGRQGLHGRSSQAGVLGLK